MGAHNDVSSSIYPTTTTTSVIGMTNSSHSYPVSLLSITPTTTTITTLATHTATHTSQQQSKENVVGDSVTKSSCIKPTNIPQILVVVVTSNEEKQFLDEMVVEEEPVTLGAETTMRNKGEHTNAISGSVAFRCQIRLPSNIKVTEYRPSFDQQEALKIVEQTYKDYVQEQRTHQEHTKNRLAEIIEKKRKLVGSDRRQSYSNKVQIDCLIENQPSRQEGQTPSGTNL